MGVGELVKSPENRTERAIVYRPFARTSTGLRARDSPERGALFVRTTSCGAHAARARDGAALQTSPRVAARAFVHNTKPSTDTNFSSKLSEPHPQQASTMDTSAVINTDEGSMVIPAHMATRFMQLVVVDGGNRLGATTCGRHQHPPMYRKALQRAVRRKQLTRDALSGLSAELCGCEHVQFIAAVLELFAELGGRQVHCDRGDRAQMYAGSAESWFAASLQDAVAARSDALVASMLRDYGELSAAGRADSTLYASATRAHAVHHLHACGVPLDADTFVTMIGRCPGAALEAAAELIGADALRDYRTPSGGDGGGNTLLAAVDFECTYAAEQLRALVAYVDPAARNDAGATAVEALQQRFAAAEARHRTWHCAAMHSDDACPCEHWIELRATVAELCG